MVLNLTPETGAKLRERAKREGRDPNEFAESIINAFLDGHIVYRDDAFYTTDETAPVGDMSAEITAGYKPGSLPLKTLASLFAEAIYAKTKFLREHRGQLSEYQISRLNESISWDIKLFSNFTSPRVSVAAMSEAEGKVDLYSERWHSQHRFDPGRKIFHYEHFVPVSQIRDKCLEAQNVSDVASILVELVSVVWILKSEDAKLIQNKHRSNRPDLDAAHDAYKKASIEFHTREGADVLSGEEQ